MCHAPPPPPTIRDLQKPAHTGWTGVLEGMRLPRPICGIGFAHCRTSERTAIGPRRGATTPSPEQLSIASGAAKVVATWARLPFWHARIVERAASRAVVGLSPAEAVGPRQGSIYVKPKDPLLLPDITAKRSMDGSRRGQVKTSLWSLCCGTSSPNECSVNKAE